MAQSQYTEEQLRVMANSINEFTRRKAAIDLACPEDLLRQLAFDKKWVVCTGVAKKPTCPEDLLRQLALDGRWNVRAGVAKNPSCPEDLLRQLVIDENEWVRTGVAKNSTCSEDLLRQLAFDEGWSVRAGAAKNPACPEDLLRQLAVDEDEDVRVSVAKNPSSPIDVVLLCLPCWGIGDERAKEVQAAFDAHKDKLLALAHSGLLDFDMICTGGETLKEGLTNGGQIEIYNLLMAEHLNGKAERLTDEQLVEGNVIQYIPSHRI